MASEFSNDEVRDGLIEIAGKFLHLTDPESRRHYAALMNASGQFAVASAIEKLTGLVSDPVKLVEFLGAVKEATKDWR